MFLCETEGGRPYISECCAGGEDVDRVLRLTLTPSGPGAEPLLVLSLGSQLCRFWRDQGPDPQADHQELCPDELPEVCPLR